jgi:hypothetical protein
MKRILSILYGIDDRFKLVSDTVNVCKSHFDIIRIINSGPPEFQSKLGAICPKIELKQVEFYHGDKEMCWRAHYYGLDEGDWLLWLDADERPSPLWLASMDEMIAECEVCGKTSVRTPCFNHLLKDGIVECDGKFEDFIIRMEDSKHAFLMDRFIKVTKQSNPLSVFGDHGYIMSSLRHHDKWIYRPFSICHFKSTLQFAQSCTLTMFFNPACHYSDLKRINQLLNSQEFKLFSEFKQREGIFTQNEFWRKICAEKDTNFISRFKEMASSDAFKNSQNAFVGMYNWAVLHNLNFETPDFYCGKSCCKYGNIQL